MMQLKKNVNPKGITPEALLGVMIAKQCYEDRGYTFTITSISEGTHKRLSRHYQGDAFDIRTRTLPEYEDEKLARILAQYLGKHYAVILEPDHIHVHYIRGG